MELQIEGTLIKKLEIKQPSAVFRFMEFIVETKDDKYPQQIKMQVTQDRVEKVNELPVGTKAKWFFNLRGKPWDSDKGETIYFISIDVWRFETLGAEIVEKKPEVTATDPDSDELPF